MPASTRYTTDYDLNTNVVTLQIANAQMNDLGTYIVLAENEAGRDQTFCTVHVQQIPSIDQTPMVNPEAFRFLENPPQKKPLDVDEDNENLQPPRVIVPLQDLQLKEGEPVFLICKIDGKPKPKVGLFISISIDVDENDLFYISLNEIIFKYLYLFPIVFIFSFLKFLLLYYSSLLGLKISNPCQHQPALNRNII